MIFTCVFGVFWAITSVFWYFKGKQKIDDIYRKNKDIWGYNDNNIEEVITTVTRELSFCIYGNLIISILCGVLGIILNTNLDFLTIFLYLLSLIVVYCLEIKEPAFLGYKGAPIDKNITVIIWNYLAFKDKQFNKLDLYFRKGSCVSIDEIRAVKESLNTLTDEDIEDIKDAIELSKIKTLSEFTYGSIKRYILTVFTTVFSAASLTKIIDFLFNKDKKEIGSLFSNDILSFIIVFFILLLIFSFIFLWWLNNFTIINRRRHCNTLLERYVEEAKK